MWIHDVFGVQKPIIAMCHLQAMPHDPQYDYKGGMQKVLDCARHDLQALQDGGVDGILFSNEFSQPYTHKIRPVTVSAMSRVIGELMSEIRVPYGINCISSAVASLDIAVGTSAQYIRSPISGSFSSAVGFIDIDPGEITRHRAEIGGKDVRIFSYVIPEGADYFGTRPLEELAQITEFQAKPDAICVAGMIAGSPTDTQALIRVKNAVKNTPIFVNTGCTAQTIRSQLEVADGAIVATTFKFDGKFENMVDVNRVREFMDIVKDFRKTLA